MLDNMRLSCRKSTAGRAMMATIFHPRNFKQLSQALHRSPGLTQASIKRHYGNGDLPVPLRVSAGPFSFSWKFPPVGGDLYFRVNSRKFTIHHIFHVLMDFCEFVLSWRLPSTVDQVHVVAEL